MKERENEQLNTEGSAKKDKFSHHGPILMSGTGMGSLYFSNGVELVVQNYLEATWISSWSDPQTPLLSHFSTQLKSDWFAYLIQKTLQSIELFIPSLHIYHTDRFLITVYAGHTENCVWCVCGLGNYMFLEKKKADRKIISTSKRFHL